MKTGIIAIGPILLALWIILGIIYDFTSSTICMVIACACAALIYVWVDFVTSHIDNNKEDGELKWKEEEKQQFIKECLDDSVTDLFLKDSKQNQELENYGKRKMD